MLCPSRNGEAVNNAFVGGVSALGIFFHVHLYQDYIILILCETNVLYSEFHCLFHTVLDIDYPRQIELIVIKD